MATSSEHFDPYYAWLGIPPHEQPPNYYRLLGIRAFEPNPDVIDNMSDQRTSHLETLRSGKHGKIAEQLLQKIATARVCLLNEPQRLAYDRRLREQLAGQTATPSQAPAPMGSGIGMRAPQPDSTRQRPAADQNPPPLPPLATALEIPPLAAERSAGGNTGLSSPRKSSRASRRSIGIGVAALAAIAIGAGVWAMNRSAHNPAALEQTAEHRQSADSDTASGPPHGLAKLVINAGSADRAQIALTIDGAAFLPPSGGSWEAPCAPGAHRLRAMRPGYKPIESVVYLSPGETRPIDLNWQPSAPGYLVINWPANDRAGGQLIVDGRSVPLSNSDLKLPVLPGPHTIFFVRTGFKNTSQTIDVASGDSPTVTPEWITQPTGGVASVVTPRPATRIDLLSQVDPQRDSVRGRWQKQNGALVCDPGFPAIITLPYQPDSEFQVNIVTERISGMDSIGLVIPVEGHLFTSGVDNFGGEGGYSGLEIVEGRRVNQNPLSHHGMVITNGQACKITVTVKKNRFTLMADGKLLCDWPQADYGKCALFPFFNSADPRRLSLTTWGSSYKFTSLLVTPLARPATVDDASSQAIAETKPAQSTGNLQPPTKPDNSAAVAAPTQQPDPIAIANSRKTPLVVAEKPAKPLAKTPADSDLAKANKAISELYRLEIKQAIDRPAKINLAHKLLEVGLASGDDLTGKYALLKTAAEMAAPQGDLETVERSIDGLADQFEIDSLKFRTDLLTICAKTQQNPAECSAKLNSLADELVASDRYDLARRSLNAALALKCDPAIHKQTIAHAKEIGDMEAEFKKLSASREVLGTSPNDPEANLAVGKFDCFTKGNWDLGLPQLAKGSDKALADMAALDLKPPADVAELVALADRWWETGKWPARQHALEIYDSALDQLTGVVRLKVEKRMQDSHYLRGQRPRRTAPTSGTAPAPMKKGTQL